MIKKLVFIAAALWAGSAFAQIPSSLPGCVYNSSAPTLADKQTVQLQCDSAGRLKVANTGPVTLTFPVTVAGTVTSGGIPYFNSTTQMSSSAVLGANQVVIGGGAGNPPTSSSAFTFDGAKAVITSGTITTSQPTTITQTWNAGGVTFTGLLVNVVPTAAASGSPFIDVQMNGTSIFNTTSNTAGNTTATLAAASTGSNSLNLDTPGNNNTLIRFKANGSTIRGYVGYSTSVGTAGISLFDGNAVSRLNVGLSGTSLGAADYFAWSSTANATETLDLKLFRDAANTLAQRNGANAQISRLYGTFTDASNYERLSLSYDSGSVSFLIGAENAGTGTARNLTLAPGNGALTILNASVTLSDDRQLRFSNRAYILSGAAGNLRLSNSGLTDFGLLQFGGITSSFPALKRNATAIDVRLADDSNFAPINALTATLGLGGNSTAQLTFTPNSGTAASLGMANGGTSLVFFSGTTKEVALDPAGVFLSADGSLRWTNANGNPITTTDLILARDAAGVLAQRNGANAQTFNVYNTYTDASNYERVSIGFGLNSGFFGGSVAVFGTSAAGTGTNRSTAMSSGPSGGFVWALANGGIVFGQVGVANYWTMPVSGHLLAGTDNTVDIGAAGATRPRHVYVAGNVVVGNNVTANNFAFGAAGANGDIIGQSTGVLTLRDAAGSSFNRLQFGGTTSSFPSIKRSTTSLIARLADDSADTLFQSGQLIVSGIASDATHTDSTVCQDTTTHQFYAGSGTVGICLGTSSARYKTNILPLTAGLGDLARIQAVSYSYRPGYGDPSKKLYGFTAEQMDGVLPELVGLDTEGRPNSVDWAGLVPVIVNAIKELKADNDNLRAEVKRLAVNH